MYAIILIDVVHDICIDIMESKCVMAWASYTGSTARTYICNDEFMIDHTHAYAYAHIYVCLFAYVGKYARIILLLKIYEVPAGYRYRRV